MKKLQITLLIVLSSAFFTNGAVAQNKPLACQGVASAGLRWENGGWVASSFKTDNFVLVQSGNNLTTESVAKAFINPYVETISCKGSTNAIPKIACFEQLGNFLLFDPRTLKGGISRLHGSSIDGTRRDSVSVDVFSCTPF